MSLSGSWQGEEYLEGACTSPTPSGNSRERSFLLVIAAGTGRLISHLTSKLFNELWVLLLHLLSELLAPVREVPGSASPNIPLKCPPGICHVATR